MRSPFDSLVTQKALAFLSSLDQPDLVDAMIDAGDSGGVSTKNVCAKVSPALAAKIDQVAELLGITKRRFLEAAFVEAVRRAEEIMLQEGVYDALERFEPSPGENPNQEAAA